MPTPQKQNGYAGDMKYDTLSGITVSVLRVSVTALGRYAYPETLEGRYSTG